MNTGNYFVAGIGTGVGKTVVSAILTEALKADYWKPVQAGSLDDTDRMSVEQLVSNAASRFHPEAYLLPEPMSPHASAERAGIEMNPEKIRCPETVNRLIVEGAGGVLVPFNRKILFIDIILQLKLPVILVSRHYLGSINHTLLSAEALKQRGIPVKGLIFNGAENTESESVIVGFTRLPVLGRVDETVEITKGFVRTQSLKFT